MYRVIVTGDTRPYRHRLRAVSLHWSPGDKAWKATLYWPTQVRKVEAMVEACGLRLRVIRCGHDRRGAGGKA